MASAARTPTEPASALRSGRTIVLVGLMGAGKSTVGKRLAKALNLPFRDSDAEIEAAAGRGIADVFADFGEATFRDGERKVIARLLEQPERMVLALGGGAFADAAIRKLVKDKAVSVWLKADLDTLMTRVRRREGRPLLQTDDPRAVMAGLMEKRESAYAEADLHVEAGRGPHDETVEAIVAALHGLGETAQ